MNADKGLTARQAALAAMNRVLADRVMLSEALPPLMAGLAPAERARAQGLVTGALRWMDRSDRVLGPYLRNMPYLQIMNALRLGVFEICHEMVAPHGAVSAWVDAVKADPQARRGAGLVNAVLRRVAAGDIDRWADMPPPRLPKWLRKRLVAAWGKAATEAMEAAHARGAATDITVKAAPEEWAARLGAQVLPGGSLRLPAGQITALPGFAEGAWWVQDLAAAIPARLLGAALPPAARILDLCAAPGGKTMQLAAMGHRVTALDLSGPRLERLRENLARTGLQAEVVCADALHYADGGFDAVLLDAPCSATGTIRRHPDLPYCRDDTAIEALVALQAQLVDHAFDLVAPGGLVVFCTCSLLPQEGEAQVAAALVRQPGWRLASEHLAPGWLPAAWTGPAGIRTRPDLGPDGGSDDGGVDGFFIAMLQRIAQSGD